MDIKNAAPYHKLLGVDDKSSVQLMPTEKALPQHLPLVFIMGPNGTTKPVLTTGAERLALYGSETYNKKGKYYNHATTLSEVIGAKGNIQLTKRITMPDAKKAYVALYLDVAVADIPNYKRTSQGAIVTDENGPVVDEDTPTILGTKVKVISEYTDGVSKLGLLETKSGTMLNKDGSTSTMYPIKEDMAKDVGADYGNMGYHIAGVLEGDFAEDYLEAGFLPYKFGYQTRIDPTYSPTAFKSLYGEKESNVVFKEDAVNPITKGTIEASDIINTNYFNETEYLMPLVYNLLEDTKIYYENLELVLKKIMTNEKEYISMLPEAWHDGEQSNTLSWFDFTTDDPDELMDELHLLNWVTFRSSKNVKYFTVELDNTTVTLAPNQKEEVLSSSTPIYLRGGSDGTITNENFEKEIVTYMQQYLDEASEVMDLAINVESILYDSGFTLDTKFELCNFIALRKDTIIALTTHDASLGENYLQLSEEKAMADALKARLNLTAESEYFGTSVCRGIVVGGTAKVNDNSIKSRVPLILQIASFAADFFGASVGKWKTGKSFDMGYQTVIYDYKDIQPEFIPDTIKPVLYNSGLIYPQPYDRELYHFEHMQTIYDDDTSVLNSFFVIMAITKINKTADKCHKMHTGSTKMTQAQFEESVTGYMEDRLKSDVFDDFFVIVPEVIITDLDEQRGYSWTLASKIYANNSKTVMTSYVEAWRMSDLNA